MEFGKKKIIPISIEGLDLSTNFQIWKYLMHHFNDKKIYGTEFPRCVKYDSYIFSYLHGEYNDENEDNNNPYYKFGAICNMLLLDIYDWYHNEYKLYEETIKDGETHILLFNGYFYKLLYFLTPKLYKLIDDNYLSNYNTAAHYLRTSYLYNLIPKCDYIIRIKRKSLSNNKMKCYISSKVDGSDKDYVCRVNDTFNNYKFKDTKYIIDIDADNFKDGVDIAKHIIYNYTIK